MKIVLKLKKFIDIFGWFALIRLPFYPLTLLLTSPIQLVRTLWNSRILLDGKWSDYNQFDAYSGLNYLFYRTQAVNLKMYGRSGTSPLIGLGAFPMSKWWHITLPSLYAYDGAGPVLTILSMFGWLLIHFVWFTSIPLYWGGAILFLALISTSFFSGAFISLNYNAMGWAFFPLGVWGLFKGYYGVAAISWFFASMGSITVVFTACILTLAYSILNQTLYPLMSIAPAMLKFLTHFFYLLSGHGIKGIIHSIIYVAKAIGTIDKGTKYKYSTKLISIIDIYYILLYLFFATVLFFIGSEYFILWLCFICLYIINTRFFRYADVQSLYMTMLSISTAIALQHPNLFLLIAYWLVISPLPILMFGRKKQNTPCDMLPSMAPFYVKHLIDSMSLFLGKVKQGKKILICFENPLNIFNEIFGGYKPLLELALYSASKKKIHLFPDWYAIFENNYDGAPEFWGRDIKEVNENVDYWNPDYIIIYQETGTEINSKWINNGYKIISELDWGHFKNEFRDRKPFRMERTMPKWWLLEAPEQTKCAE